MTEKFEKQMKKRFGAFMSIYKRKDKVDLIAILKNKNKNKTTTKTVSLV